MTSFLRGDRVKFTSGEYVGMTGVIVSTIPMRYKNEIVTHRVQIDGYPKPGGWNGLVLATENQIEKV